MFMLGGAVPSIFIPVALLLAIFKLFLYSYPLDNERANRPFGGWNVPFEMFVWFCITLLLILASISPLIFLPVALPLIALKLWCYAKPRIPKLNGNKPGGRHATRADTKVTQSDRYAGLERAASLLSELRAAEQRAAERHAVAEQRALAEHHATLDGDEKHTPLTTEMGRTHILGNNDGKNVVSTATITELREIKGIITDIPISDKIGRIEELTGKIFRIVEENPAKLPEIRRFTDFYIPITLKLLHSYATLEKLGISGENITSAKESIDIGLDTLTKFYEQQLDQLFESYALDIAADIDVLKSMIKQDGLSSDNPLRHTVAFARKG
jgi:hypothetical protein